MRHGRYAERNAPTEWCNPDIDTVYLRYNDKSSHSGAALPSEINWLCGLCNAKTGGPCGHRYGIWSKDKDFSRPIIPHQDTTFASNAELNLDSPKILHGLAMKFQDVDLQSDMRGTYRLLHRFKVKEFLIVIEEIEALDKVNAGVVFEKPSQTYDHFIANTRFGFLTFYNE